jgi:hypothetical protein
MQGGSKQKLRKQNSLVNLVRIQQPKFLADKFFLPPLALQMNVICIIICFWRLHFCSGGKGGTLCVSASLSFSSEVFSNEAILRKSTKQL